MTDDKVSSGIVQGVSNLALETYDRREVLGALIAIPIVLAVHTSSAGDAMVDYPVWEIKKGSGLVYLLGHTPPRPTDWSDARIEKLLQTCGALWDETNQVEQTDAQGLIQRYGIDPSKPLNAWLSASDRDRLSQAAKISGVPEGSLQTFRPWLAGQALEGAFFSAKGMNGRNADSVLVSQATKAGLSVSSEFARKEDAARWFTELSAEQEVQYLRYIVDELLAGHDEGQRIYAAWAKGKDAPATEWVSRMKRLYPELYQSLVLARNQAWVPRIQSMLTQNKPVMVVVGLYHLVGPDCIQAQLRANDLRAKRI